jgi:Styrene monooxygenase A putative substrate binding domain
VRKILIVGAGQSGLQLALSLQAEGYDVTVMSARTPEEIRSGWPTSTQAMFAPALDRERAYGLNLWDRQAPPIPGNEIGMSPEPGVQAFTLYEPWDKPGNSVDQRLKMSAWLELFEERGGRVIYHTVMTSDLAGLAAMYDLTVIAAGKGELVEMFDRDPERSRYTAPQRHLAAIYLNGLASPYPDDRVRISIQPGAGEILFMPALTLTGPCGIMLVEALPGGPLDVFTDRPFPAEHLRRLRVLLDERFPWEAALFADAEPTDARASLVGAFTPTVRKPTAEVAPGLDVFGMADVVVVNDPVSGQGANNAAHCAAIYGRAILDRGGEPFDRKWMEATFEAFWSPRACGSVALTTMFLEPPAPHVQQMLGAAAQYPPIAKRICDLIVDPSDIQGWLLDPDKASAYLASVTAAG